MSSEYTIKEGTFQHIVLEGTSYEVGKMQGEIIKETENAELEDSPEQYLIATNHYTLGNLPQYNKKKGVLGHSTARYNAIESSIKEDLPNVTRETFRGVLTREIPEGCFCPYYSHNLGTLRSMIFDLTDVSAEMCFGAPTHNEWHTFTLDEPVGVKEYHANFPDKKV